MFLNIGITVWLLVLIKTYYNNFLGWEVIYEYKKLTTSNNFLILQVKYKLDQ